MNPLDRRNFMAAAIGGAALLDVAKSSAQIGQASAGQSIGPMPAETRRGDMIYRALGRTGENVSLCGLGGSHIGQAASEDLATKIVRTAIDRGVNFMDNAWDYNNGNGQAEIRMGKALRDGYRQKVFLMTKIDGRTKESAAKQIDESLQRLQTDHVDLLQYHEVVRMEDPDRIFAPGGAHEAFADAKKAGKLRFIGFTGHKDPAIHLRMLDVAQQHGFHFDAVLHPSNVMDYSFRSFVHQVMPRALKDGIGVQTMKPLGGKFILQSNTVSATECLHYAMSMPTSVVITGCDKMEILEQALNAVKTFRPLTESQVSSIVAKTKAAAFEGKYELFKTTAHFDSTAKNPQWLG